MRSEEEIPTPRSDEQYRYCVEHPGPGNGLVFLAKMQELERELAVAHQSGVLEGLRLAAEKVKELNAPLSIRRFYDRDITAILSLAEQIKKGEVKV